MLCARPAAAVARTSGRAKVPEAGRFDDSTCDVRRHLRRIRFVTDLAEVLHETPAVPHAAGFTVVALAGAVGLPDLAGAQDATTTDSITVNGVDGGRRSERGEDVLGAETRRDTAQAAVAANGDAMRRILNALRQAVGASSRPSG